MTSRDSESPEVTLGDVERARSVIDGAVARTPFAVSRTLSRMFGADLWLKFENLQFTASYKERGALNRLTALAGEARRRGVIAMSAGNHGQGIAYHAARLGIPATIVMPESTPAVKVDNTRALGANVILEGATLEEAGAFALRFGRERDLTFIHPYDDPLVIAGQGTIALEMLEDNPDLDVLVVPVGGGGLAAGLCVAAKAVKPSIRIVGVQARLYPGMYNRLAHETLPVGGATLAEGIAVKEPGAITEKIARRALDEIVLVGEGEIERAVCLLLSVEKTLVEGAGAAGLAAVIAEPQRFAGLKVGLPLTGGNIDTRLLASVLTRELARDGRLSRLSVDVPDRPGELGRVAAAIGCSGASIVEVYHQRVFTDLPARGTELNLVIETRDATHLASVLESLRSNGYDVVLKGGANQRT